MVIGKRSHVGLRAKLPGYQWNNLFKFLAALQNDISQRLRRRKSWVCPGGEPPTVQLHTPLQLCGEFWVAQCLTQMCKITSSICLHWNSSLDFFTRPGKLMMAPLVWLTLENSTLWMIYFKRCLGWQLQISATKWFWFHVWLPRNHTSLPGHV